MPEPFDLDLLDDEDPPETLEEVRRLAAADDRSVSSWIRRAVEHELEQQVR